MRGLAALVGLTLLTGCATKPSAPDPRPRPRPPVTVGPSAPALSPADYFAISASRSLLMVRASELAAAREPSLAADAARIEAQHRGVAAQLNLAGRRLNLLPSAELLPTDRQQLEALERSGNVTQAWGRIVGTALANCDRHESAYAERGSSPTLRPVARFTLGVCRDELARRR